ncbi:hypothetical protein H0H87_005024 [Tephrocybe sp. NHM501043]|nr:hypothetical protein H0H87_005024 [Tephrocybe sp. NHM501043]
MEKAIDSACQGMNPEQRRLVDARNQNIRFATRAQEQVMKQAEPTKNKGKGPDPRQDNDEEDESEAPSTRTELKERLRSRKKLDKNIRQAHKEQIKSIKKKHRDKIPATTCDGRLPERADVTAHGLVVAQ